MATHDLILKKYIYIKWAVGAKFTATYISNRNLQNLQLALFDKTKRWKKI